MNTVCFACIHNAGRSQMAAAFVLLLGDPARVRALSAGTDPAARVHPEVVTVMREVGIDLSDREPTRLTPELASGCQVLVTMGCGEACPVLPGVELLDWPLPDPKGQGPEAVRQIRDDIRERVRHFLEARGWLGAGA